MYSVMNKCADPYWLEQNCFHSTVSMLGPSLFSDSLLSKICVIYPNFFLFFQICFTILAYAIYLYIDIEQECPLYCGPLVF